MKKMQTPLFCTLLLSAFLITAQAAFAQAGGGGKPELVMYKHNSSSNGAVPVLPGDLLGEIKYTALSAVNSVRTGVSIRSYVTGPVDANHLPANLIFRTGSTGPFDRMVITAEGLVGIGTMTPGFNLDVEGNTHTSGDFFGRIHMDPNAGNPGPDTYLEEAYFENKSGTEIAAPDASRGGLLTMAPTNNTAGATDHQLFLNDGGIYHRKEAANAGAWAGAWEKLLTSEDINGTPNRVAKFTGPSKLGDSQLWDDGANVGIATTTPAAKLDVNGNTRLGGNVNATGNLQVSGNLGTGGNAAVGNSLVVSSNANVGGDLAVNNSTHVGTDARIDGRVIVGNPPTTPGTHRMYVNGSIIATEVKVALQASWPDFVFEPGFNAPDLCDWEQFIAENKHLPGVPSAATVQQNGGIELGEMNRVLLQKVEELTLLLIAQQKQIDALRTDLRKVQH